MRNANSAAILRAEAVAYRYADNGHTLSPVSLEAEAGGCLAVTGVSGCGKSTLARCLTGLIPHLYRGEMAGSVWIENLHTTTTSLWELSERAGMVFQNPAAQMLATTVENEIIFGLENLGLPRPEIAARLEQALTQFGLIALRGRDPRSLSGGEQQRLALASIMSRRPAALVLDEPFSMLDGDGAADLVAALAELTAQGAASVACEHRLEWLETLPGLRTLHLAAPHPPAEIAHVIPPLARKRMPFMLDVRGLSVQRGVHEVLHNLEFHALGGEVIAIVGRNGAGKTTLLRALAGLQRAEGVITVDGGSPNLGMVFQNPDVQLFNASVREEILYRIAAPDRELYAWLLKALGLERYEATPPLLLSEGEKKRLALATVLMRQPRDGILLDEPALGQDDGHKTQLLHLTRALAHAGQLVILTTHDLALAAQADRLLLLAEGHIIAEGTPAAVLGDTEACRRAGMRTPERRAEGAR
ncbi:MAG: ATP-binding cassette domain-containing protein [Anaerolineae bacterium]|nr:ATP-binding cassette domain-containing protein [Anaerolineae bacterium]